MIPVLREPARAQARRMFRVAGLVVLGAVLAIGVPLFLCMPPWADVTMYDVAARIVMSGGTLYKDVFDTNWPGGIWVQTVVRSMVGWRYDTLRAFDLLVVSAALFLLVEWLGEIGAGATARIWSAAAVCSYYLFQPESVHCQRDVWMLLPVLLALRLRRRRIGVANGAAARTAVVAACEGMLWAAAIWIKPFAAVPALACWLASMRVGVAADVPKRLLAADALGMFVGGVIIGAAGVGWLAHTGALLSFYDVMLHWTPDYASHVYGLRDRSRMLMLSSMANMPWVLMHAAAAPAAFGLLKRRRGLLLGTLYWSWLLQAALLQPRLHDYVVASMLLIAIPIGVAFGIGALLPYRLRPAVVAVAMALMTFRHPVFRADRLALWPAAVAHGNTVALRDRLSLMPSPQSHGLTDWTDLTRVASYLVARQTRDGELTCFNESTHPLYLMLNIQPSVRFIQSNLIVQVFESHHSEVMEELRAAHARFVVTDLSSILARPDTPTDAVPAPWNERYPWTLPVVFRAGRYFVHEPAEPITPFWR
jgi:hypothetical protein